MRTSDVLTMGNAASGVAALFFALEGRLEVAGALLILGLIFDWLDGRVARKSGKLSKFGVYLDSLADIVTFGVVPVGILFSLERSLFICVAGMWFVVAGVYRLARFQMTTGVKHFVGMPITVNGLILGLLLILYPNIYSTVAPWYFILAGILMVSTLKVKKL